MSLWEYANPRKFTATANAVLPFISIAAAVLLIGGLIWGFFFTPDDYRQGSTVKIIYLHVPAAIVAKPGSKAYGRLALLASWRCDAQIVMELPPEAFTPAPKVHSAVVHLTALPKPRFPANPKTLERVIAAAFNQRRKMLRASLKGVHPDIQTIMGEVGIDPTARAETLTLEQFCALARRLDA